MKLDSVKRIVKEEFPKEDQETIDRLSYILNNFMDNVIKTVNGNLSIENFTQEIKVIDMIVDDTGKPKINSKIRTTLSNKVIGIHCIKAENLTNTSTYPVATPFVSFSINSQLIDLKNIAGLQADQKYRLTLLFIS